MRQITWFLTHNHYGKIKTYQILPVWNLNTSMLDWLAQKEENQILPVWNLNVPEEIL